MHSKKNNSSILYVNLAKAFPFSRARGRLSDVHITCLPQALTIDEDTNTIYAMHASSLTKCCWLFRSGSLMIFFILCTCVCVSLHLSSPLFERTCQFLCVRAEHHATFDSRLFIISIDRHPPPDYEFREFYQMENNMSSSTVLARFLHVKEMSDSVL